MLEIVSGQRWIGDRNEGVRITKAGRIEMSPDNQNEAARKALREINFIDDRGTGNTIIIDGMTFVSNTDCFIFSASHGDLAELVQGMSDPALGIDAYDGCININDFAQFAKILFFGGTFGNGLPVKDHFNCRVDVVRYEDREDHKFETSNSFAPGDPFLKSTFYRQQHEIRIALYPRKTINADAIFLQARLPEGLLEVTDLGLNAAPARPVMTEDDRQTRDEDTLDLICQRLDDWCAHRAKYPKIDMFDADWMAQAAAEREREVADFPPYRDALVKALWEVRHLDSGHWIDDAILNDFPPAMFISRVCLFLMGCGRTQHPC